MIIGGNLGTTAMTTGFLFGLGLMLSIGPQNLRLIRAGIDGRHATSVATTGYISEIVIVILGIAGIGALLAHVPAAATIAHIGGVAFLLWCAAQVIRGGVNDWPDGSAGRYAETRLEAVRSMLAVTWLNPLVYVEVMLLVGVLSSSYDLKTRAWFAGGFLLASACRFYGWSLAGRLVAPMLQSPRRRRLFDLASGAMLIVVASLLAVHLALGTAVS